MDVVTCDSVACVVGDGWECEGVDEGLWGVEEDTWGGTTLVGSGKLEV